MLDFNEMASRSHPSMMSLYEVKMSHNIFGGSVTSSVNVCKRVFNNVHEFMFVHVVKEDRKPALLDVIIQAI